jgi:predicted secreted hydrolase
MARRRYAVILLAALAGCGEAPSGTESPRAGTGLRFLGGETADGFARATVPREFAFPADHGSHPEFRTEWWYFTGNLMTPSARHFGFELTFFRYALAAATPASANDSAWRTTQVWMAHFAITDSEGRRFLTSERFTREALGLAGATPEPLRIWLKDWAVAGQHQDGALALRLDADDGEKALGLDLTSTIPPIAHGDRGLDRKGADAGNASYYYSVPRLAADGFVTVDGERFSVMGSAWLDREWSTSSLEPGIVGWDWFALQLSNGGSLMYYRLRTATGDTSPFSGGSLVDASGLRTSLEAADVALTPLDHWTSTATGARYPVAWRLEVPSANMSLDIRPRLDDQEVELSVRYWEGAVHGEGVGPQGPLGAEGYLELAGY